MTSRRARTDLEGRLEEVRRLFREHHARVEPDPQFANRVIARLPRDSAWSFEWAVRRILPVSVALAVALTIVVLAVGGAAGRRGAAESAAVSASSSSANGSDPLDWLLEGRQEVR